MHEIIHAIRLAVAFARGRIDRNGNPIPATFDKAHADRASRGIVKAD